MALKAILESIDDVDEAIRPLYREESGKFILDIDGAMDDHPSVAALKRARDHEKKAAADAKKRVTELESEFDKYKDLDPERAREALSKIQEIEDKQMLEAGDVDKLVEQKTERMRADFESKLKAKDDALDAAQKALTSRESELADIKIFTAVKDAAVKAGARPTALDDIVNRAKPIFHLIDGQVIPTKPGTEDTWYGANGDAMSIEEWVTSLSGDADHLFEPNGGGGSTGSGGSTRQRDGVKVISRSQAGDYIDAIAAGEAVIGD